MDTLYALAKETIAEMKVGELKEIKVPGNLRAFRKYLSEIATKEKKKFSTRLTGRNLHIMRVQYSSIQDKLSGEI